MVAPLVFDRVQESATTLGSGDFTLLGAEAGGFRTFASVLSIGQTTFYCIQNTSQNEWEVGLGTLSASNTLSRTTVLASSNANALVSFSAGTKDVFIDAPASLLSPWAATGDIPYLAATGLPTVLPIGTSSFVLAVSGGLPAWVATPSSVSNSDGSLTVSPTTGIVVASLNVAHANTWTAQQTFSISPPTAPFGSGSSCERFGANSGSNPASGSSNTAFGNLVLNVLSTGANNTACGSGSGQLLADGSNNTFVGALAGQKVVGGSNNALVGLLAGQNMSSGGTNTLVGSLAGSTVTTESANICIGTLSDISAAGVQNAIALGMSAVAGNNEFGLAPDINFQTWYGSSSTSTTRQRADLTLSWVDSTDATRKAKAAFNVWDTSARETWECESDGSGANFAFFGTGSYGSGRNVVFISNAAVEPTTNPSGGGILYALAGALKWRGSSGTRTTIAAADPHCPVCGADFVAEFDNDRFGYLMVCLKCLADELGSKPWIIRR